MNEMGSAARFRTAEFFRVKFCEAFDEIRIEKAVEWMTTWST